MKITLIRHGEMKGDPFVRPERPVSGCLSDQGVRQAEAAARALATAPFDVALSSPYGRALQTAEVIFADRNVPIEILDCLHEWVPNTDLGTVTDTEFEQMLQMNEGTYVEETWKTELGEGCFDMYARICPAFLKKLDHLGIHSRMGGYVPEEDAKDISIAVVAHGGSLNVLLSFILGIPPFPIGRFAFALAGSATIEFVERRGIYYPQLVIPSPE